MTPLILTIKGGGSIFAPLFDLESRDELSNAWRVCTKVKDALEQGSRLENMSWRLWFIHNSTSVKELGDKERLPVEEVTASPHEVNAAPAHMEQTLLLDSIQQQIAYSRQLRRHQEQQWRKQACPPPPNPVPPPPPPTQELHCDLNHAHDSQPSSFAVSLSTGQSATENIVFAPVTSDQACDQVVDLSHDTHLDRNETMPTTSCNGDWSLGNHQPVPNHLNNLGLMNPAANSAFFFPPSTDGLASMTDNMPFTVDANEMQSQLHDNTTHPYMLSMAIATAMTTSFTQDASAYASASLSPLLAQDTTQREPVPPQNPQALLKTTQLPAPVAPPNMACPAQQALQETAPLLSLLPQDTLQSEFPPRPSETLMSAEQFFVPNAPIDMPYPNQQVLQGAAAPLFPLSAPDTLQNELLRTQTQTPQVPAEQLSATSVHLGTVYQTQKVTEDPAAADTILNAESAVLADVVNRCIYPASAEIESHETNDNYDSMSTTSTHTPHSNDPRPSQPRSYSNSSLPKERVNASASSLASDKKTICTNCGTTSTPLWRRSEEDDILCNACGLYRKLHKAHRPKSMKSHAQRADAERNDGETQQPMCTNCETTTTPLWRRDEYGASLCNACGLYLKLHHAHRPVSMRTEVIKKRQRTSQPKSDRRMSKKPKHNDAQVGAHAPSAEMTMPSMPIILSPDTEQTLSDTSTAATNAVASASTSSSTSSSVHIL